MVRKWYLESLLIFLFHGTEFELFSSAEGFGTEFREFASSSFDQDLHSAYNEKTLNCEKSMNI